MKVSLEKAKNGETTATCDNLYLHSSYNPTREAQRFVDNLTVDYEPPFIVITEPGLGYCIPLLRNKFKNSKIIIIRYCEELSSYNSQGDLAFNYFRNNDTFGNQLINEIGEENVINTMFLQWAPSSLIFKDLETKLLKDVKDCFQKAKTLLVTREFFEKKWLLNTVKLVKYCKNIVLLQNKISKPVLIMSSGPSLQNVIKTIKENRDKFFIICLSSAIKVAFYNNIRPDLAISTDGGYWAGQHLKTLYKENIPLAIPGEGYIQPSLLEKLNILPLNYGDGLSSEIMKIAEIKSMKGYRNGTVSGTALQFALDNSNGNIYFAGLDMSGQKGLQHCQPNENELNNKINDFKLVHQEKRGVVGEYSEGVLNIYKEWFQHFKLNNRKVYRIIDKEYKKNSLGEIVDISVTEFNQLLKNEKTGDFKFIKLTNKSNMLNVKKYLTNYSNSDKWKKSLFPLSYSSLIHNEKNMDIVNRLNKENSTLLKKIGNLINE